MKKYLIIFMMACLTALCVFSTFSCSQKTGCPAYEDLHTKTDRKGRLSSKPGKSGLFPKDMKRKMK